MKPTPSSARVDSPARATPPTCSSLRWRGASCAPSRPPPGPSTKKYFEKDAALARRFQLIKVEEPDELLAAAMLRGIVPLMESHFGVRVLDEAVTEAVRLSHRYITERQLPDKAISVLDTACARVALAQSSLPARIDDAQMRLQGLRSEVTALEREANRGAAR